MKLSSNSSRVAGGSALSVLAAFLLLLSAPTTAALRTQSSDLPYGVIVPPGYFQYYPIQTVSSTSTVTFVVSSNTSLSTAFMSSSQFASFNNGESDVSDALYLDNASSLQETLSESIGTYYLVFYAYGHTANVSYNLQSNPVDPYFVTPLPPPEPTGVASYGLYNVSGNAVPYQVETSEVVGIADIAALQAYNASAAVDESNISGATMQLNTILVVNEQGGDQQVYWAQNTPDFVTAASQMAYGDNIWNFSVSGDLSNSTITSPDGGLVSPNTGSTGDYYSQEVSNMTYSFPMALALLVNETVIPGQGVMVQMGAQMLQNGTVSATPVDWFDSATIQDPTVQSAYFLVSGSQTTPNGLYYDTEFVFCGENDGEATNFTQLSASMGLFYYDSTGGVLQSFPSLYSFGGDTAEGADNLQVASTGTSFAQVSIGTPNYVYLGNATGTLSLPLTTSEVTTSGASSTASGATSTSSSAQSSQSSQSTSAATTQSSQSGSSVAFSASYALTLTAVASVLVLAAALGSSRRAEKGGRTGTSCGARPSLRTVAGQ